jgi:hypothetical protein
LKDSKYPFTYSTPRFMFVQITASPRHKFQQIDSSALSRVLQQA